MAVNLTEPTALNPVAGIRLAPVAAGIRYRNRDDLLLMEIAPGATTAAVFTQNAFCAAPVIVAREHLAREQPGYLLINAGNANAGTGLEGIEAARAACAAVARATGCAPAAVLPFSTGVIGEPLPIDRIAAAIPAALSGLSADNWPAAMRSIMTTDTVGKGCSRRFTWNGREATITGIAKGSGMIRPDMATMLAFIATDAVVPEPVLRATLASVVEETFNCITVDGDTSTNDALVVVATGRSGLVAAAGEALDVFRATLLEVCLFLAQAIVRDGEGATKFIAVTVTGADDREEARRAAFTVAHSPLVKTALFASDPNWGRILAAVGRAGIDRLDVSRVTIAIGGVRIVEGGGRAASYTEEAGQRAMRESEIQIGIDLGRGGASATVWTCDFSFEYVRINAEYRS